MTVTHVVAKTLVFNADGKLLVLTRSKDDEHRPGGLDFPGGQVEDGEPFLDGAVREAYEEAGLKLNPDAMQLCISHSKVGYRKSLEADVNIVWLGFATSLPEGEAGHIVLSHEHEAYQWLSLDELVQASDHPMHHDLVDYLRRNRIVADLWHL